MRAKSNRKEFLESLKKVKEGMTVSVWCDTINTLTSEQVVQTSPTFIVTTTKQGRRRLYSMINGCSSFFTIIALLPEIEAVPAPHNTYKRFLLVIEEDYQYRELDSTDYASEAKRLAAYYREHGHGQVVILCSAHDHKLLNS